MPNYDFVLIIDSDALFLDQEKRIEDLVHKYIDNHENVCIVAGEDCLNENSCYAKNALNTGVMLFANKPKTLQIIDHWISAADKECSDWKYRHTREQMCLQILKDQKYNDNIKIIPYYEMNGEDGKWVRYYMDMPNEDRFKLFEKHFLDFFASECNLPTTSLTPQILSKEFLTTLTPKILSKEGYCMCNVHTKRNKPLYKYLLFFFLLLLFGLFVSRMPIRRRKIV